MLRDLGAAAAAWRQHTIRLPSTGLLWPRKTGQLYAGRRTEEQSFVRGAFEGEVPAPACAPFRRTSPRRTQVPHEHTGSVFRRHSWLLAIRHELSKRCGRGTWVSGGLHSVALRRVAGKSKLKDSAPPAGQDRTGLWPRPASSYAARRRASSGEDMAVVCEDARRRQGGRGECQGCDRAAMQGLPFVATCSKNGSWRN